MSLGKVLRKVSFRVNKYVNVVGTEGLQIHVFQFEEYSNLTYTFKKYLLII
jgi:hypothetical protein